eukprot:UN02557
MLKMLHIRPRKPVLDKITSAFGMDSWAITYDAFGKTLPQDANEEKLYAFLKGLLEAEHNKGDGVTQHLKDTLLQRCFEKPDSLDAKEMLLAIKKFGEVRQTMIDKILHISAQKHLFLNQIRNMKRDEQNTIEITEGFRTENEKLTLKIVELNQK